MKTQSKPKALLFAMESPTTAAQAEAVARNLVRVGYDCVVCDYAARVGVDPRRLSGGIGGPLLTVADRGLDSVPWLSGPVYRERYGDDCDFAALLALQLPTAPGEPGPRYELLNPESEYRQKLRGFASRCEELMRAIAPDLVVIQQGAEVLSRILLAKTMKLGLPWLLSESSFLSGYILLDPAGQHFMRGFNQIDSEWPEWRKRLPDAQAELQAAAFIERWRSQRQSKYVQPNDLAPDVVEFLDKPGRLLFVPMQVDGDANVFFGLGSFRSLRHFYESVLDALPRGWRLVFKPHPMDCGPNPWRPPADPRVLRVESASVHDLIERADAVAVFSSNVGLEALFYRKPVIVGGRPWYGAKGLTLDVEGPQDLAETLSAAPWHQVDSGLRDRLIVYLLTEYLVADGDLSAFERKLARTGPAQAELTSARMPFSEADPLLIAPYVQRLRACEALLQDGLDYRRILDRLGLPAQSQELQTPMAAKDWRMAWVKHQDGALASAYLFAARMVKVHGEILDCGCGNGFGAWILARKGLRVSATEASDALLDYAYRTWAHRGIIHQQFSEAEILHGALTGQQYDAVLLIDRLSYLRRPADYLCALWDAVATGGQLLVRLVRPELAIRPGIACPLHLFELSDLSGMLPRLPDVAAHRFFFQDREHLRLAPAADNEYIWMLLEKAAELQKTASWSKRLDETLPVSIQAPTESRISDILSVLARRRRKLMRSHPVSKQVSSLSI